MTNKQIYKQWCEEMEIGTDDIYYGLVIEDSPFETEDDEQLTFSIYVNEDFNSFEVNFFDEDENTIKVINYPTPTQEEFKKVLYDDDCDPIWLAQKLWNENK